MLSTPDRAAVLRNAPPPLPAGFVHEEGLARSGIAGSVAAIGARSRVEPTVLAIAAPSAGRLRSMTELPRLAQAAPTLLEELAKVQPGPGPILTEFEPPRPRDPNDPNARREYDLNKIRNSGLVGGATMASSFGFFCGAVGTALRVHGGLPQRVITSFMPPLSGAVSAILEPGFEHLVGDTATRLPTPPRGFTPEAMIYHAILPVCFMTGNYAYMFSALPKFAPGSPQAGAMAVLVSATSAFVGKSGMEWFAQWLAHEEADAAAREGRPPRVSEKPDTEAVAVGRSASQLPATLVHLGIAARFRGVPIPDKVQRTFPGVIGVPYLFRGELTPRDQGPAAPRSPAPPACACGMTAAAAGRATPAAVSASQATQATQMTFAPAAPVPPPWTNLHEIPGPM